MTVPWRNAPLRLFSRCPDVPACPACHMSHSDRPTMQVAVVCLAALTSGKMHCLLDAKDCEEASHGGTAQALLPLAGGSPSALAHRTLSASPTVRVSWLQTHSAENFAPGHIQTHVAPVVPFQQSCKELIPRNQLADEACCRNGGRIGCCRRSAQRRGRSSRAWRSCS